MQAKVFERTKAIILRRQGLSYAEIQKILPVSQASLSLWLQDVTLTDVQRKRLASLSRIGQIAGAKARRQQRLQSLAKLEQEVEKELPQLLLNPFFMLGLALYWAEGSKQKAWNVSQCVRFCNSDPKMILLLRSWLHMFGSVAHEDFQYRLYIHATANVEQAKEKWATMLKISPAQIPVSLKKHIIVGRHKQEDYMGLITIHARRSTWLNRRIELWTKGAASHFLGII